MKDLNKDIVSLLYGLSIHYSADCNMDCAYCYISKKHKFATTTNQQIRAALQDGTFLKNIIALYDNYPEYKDQVDVYALWGAEPTINGEYFAQFHKGIMDNFPNIQKVEFSTNGWCGGAFLVENFVKPAMAYAIEHKRFLKFDIQFSLDGPPNINEKTRRPGATARTLEALHTVIDAVENSPYFQLDLNLKSTLSFDTLRGLCSLQALQEYYNWCDNVMCNLRDWAKDKTSVDYRRVNFTPTFVTPITATVDDGKMFAQWLRLLTQLDYSHFNYYNNDWLFGMGVAQMHLLLEYGVQNVDHLYQMLSCSAGKNSWHIEPDGTISDCSHVSPLLMEANFENNKTHQFILDSHVISQNFSNKELHHFYGAYAYHAFPHSRFALFTTAVAALISAGQLDAKYATNHDELLALWFISSQMGCHLSDQEITGNEFLTTFGRIRIWGNGAVDALKEYMQFENQRLYMQGDYGYGNVIECNRS